MATSTDVRRRILELVKVLVLLPEMREFDRKEIAPETTFCFEGKEQSTQTLRIRTTRQDLAKLFTQDSQLSEKELMKVKTRGCYALLLNWEHE